MLSFELKNISNREGELEIYCDTEGLDSLLAQLRFLKEGRTEHIDLLSISWGGTQLDDGPHNSTAIPIRSVKILLKASR